ncbi:MAG: GTPase domain-containing protein [Myxococcota bacterium]
MPRINPRTSEITCKVVYYGAGNSGKTTNLIQLHSLSDAEARTSLVGVSAEAERSVFFEYFAADLGRVANYRLRAEFYTVPGQAYFTSTRRLILDQVDGIVFVVDSDPMRFRDNERSLDDLRNDLGSYGRSVEEVPLVVQLNKRDLVDAMPEAELARHFNPLGRPVRPASARQGDGVEATRDAILASVFEDLKRRVQRGRPNV